jgi:hypothetical protein
MFVIAPFLLSNSHLAADTVTENDDLGVRPGRIRTMRPPQAESLRSHSNPRRRRGGFPDGRARSGRRFGHGRPASQAATRLLRARGHGAIVKARVVRPMRSPGAPRAISAISCAMKLPTMDRPANCSTRQATKRTAELLPSAGRDRLPAPGKCGGSSTGKGEVRRGPLRECKSVGGGRSRGCAGKPAGPARWILSNEAKQPLRALGATADGAPGLAKCAAAAIGSYLGYTGRSADALVRPHVTHLCHMLTSKGDTLLGG